MTSYPPGVDPAFLATARHQVDALRGQLDASRARNAALRSRLDEAQAVDHLLTKGQVKEVVSRAKIALWTAAWFAAVYVVSVLIDGRFASAGFAVLLLSFWINPARRHWQSLNEIDKAMKESK